MEIDPNGSIQEMVESCAYPKTKTVRPSIDRQTTADAGTANMMQDLAFAIPGVDEALAFAELMK